MSNSVPVLFFEDDSQFPLLRSGQYTVGAQNCDLQLQGADIQPVHAYLISSGIKVMLRPESDAVVLVNGVPSTGMIAVNPGDVITIGSHAIMVKFVLKTMAPSAPVLPRSGKNPFDFDDSLFNLPPAPPKPVAPPPVPQVSTPPAIPPLPEEDDISPVTLLEESEDIEDDFDDEGLDLEERKLQPVSADLNDDLDDEVSFTVYYPREFMVGQRGGVIVYAHVADAIGEIIRDVGKFTEELGGEVPRPRTASNKIRIQPATPITIVIECDDLEFDPPTLTRRWDDEWVRFLFEFKAPQALLDEQIVFHVSVLIRGIEVARIANCTIEILPAESSSVSSEAQDPENALRYASMTYEETRLYQRIFVSYSRQDKEVVEAYRLAQEAVGNEVFVDTYSIRTGQDWQVALANAIKEADVFQLFWSADSASSNSVRDEWDYALKHRCRDDGCRGFIRPVFWVNPMPASPPRELRHLNFRYVPLGETSA